MTELPDIYLDLTHEGENLDNLLADLDADDWARPTPAPGWTVAHQVAHLAATFRMAALAASDAAAFTTMTSRLSDDFDANVRMALAGYLTEEPAGLLERWHRERAAADRALRAHEPSEIVPWLVQPLPVAVLAAAGIMELFAHGQDIADAAGARLRRTDRIRHLVAFAVRTWNFGYLARGLPVPDVRIRFDITLPSGAPLHFGPPESAERVSGPAEDFCLLVTRRRHRDDLRLTATGTEAGRWMDIAQAYRGPAGAGRRPGQFAAAGTR
ncbi:TIGR03084 family protein [Actinoplanes sp. ATCC 53533]|uniref:TIGR03084 family metal-binding protein n=1 Tax=Actinoplanes sp. ATCC 53533 TaxID=1288362 RepID=UPI000F78F756|nr:TIGR03084 family metal-binding protein [Actinoplanes sp. ATCC 53533]RSM47494.1 TIGR03084 family protein [Actinoplanes sp. ATCC 53533]